MAQIKQPSKKKVDFTPKKPLPPIIKKGQFNFACLQFVYKLRIDKEGGDQALWIQGNYGAGGNGKKRPNNVDWKLVLNDLNGTNNDEGNFDCEDVIFYYKKDKRYAFAVRTNSNDDNMESNGNLFLDEIIKVHNGLLSGVNDYSEYDWKKHVSKLETWIDNKTAIWY